MKKIINQTDNIVMEMGKGFAKVHSALVEWNPRYKIIRRRELNPNKVAIVSGGGSGHEPAHAGFVGKGMLDAAVCGDIFASPSTMQVYHAILETRSEKGTLLIIKNYSGDVMNFNAAAEMADFDDIRVEKIYVDDDVAVEDSLFTIGRRGVAGTMLVHKIAGAAAECGLGLAEVKAISERATQNIKSIGVALTSCTVPAKGTPTFSLGESEVEYGVGIHGEPGIKRMKIQTSKWFAQDMIAKVNNELKLSKGDKCTVIVNGLGATPLMELYIYANDVYEQLEEMGIQVYKPRVGNFMTSLDMAGISLTVMKLDDELQQYLDADADTVAWK